MSVIKVEVDGVRSEVDLSPERMTLREHERLQRLIGNVRYDRFLQSGAIEIRPDFLSAYLFAKLKTDLPDLELEAIDADFTELIDVLVEMAAEADEGKA